MESKLIDHLFRHHYGKMVSVLTRIFGLEHLELIEDAVQDTFLKATISWKTGPPVNPEAWLTKAAKNRVLDIFRKLQAEKKRVPHFYNGIQGIVLNELFLESEIEDNQLRMIFTACHPSLNPKDRIAFALKTVSGFSTPEIASALLTKNETIKKRLVRARKEIMNKGLVFEIPSGKLLPERLETVMQVLYLIFNEGFHSSKKAKIVQEELCVEAMRLCQMLLKNKTTRCATAYALFGLMCFHAARLDAKTSIDDEILDLKQQDRKKWDFSLIALGNTMMNKAVEDQELFSVYHYEAAIASEHIKASSFEETDWEAILKWYKSLYLLEPTPFYLLTMAVVNIQLKDFDQTAELLLKISPSSLGQRIYLFYGTYAEYYFETRNLSKALEYIKLAILHTSNISERQFLENRKQVMSRALS